MKYEFGHAYTPYNVGHGVPAVKMNGVVWFGSPRSGRKLQRQDIDVIKESQLRDWSPAKPAYISDAHHTLLEYAKKGFKLERISSGETMNKQMIARRLIRLAKNLMSFQGPEINESKAKAQMARAEKRIKDAYDRAFQKSGDKEIAEFAVTKAIMTRIKRMGKPEKLWGSARAYDALGYDELAEAAYDKLSDLGYDRDGQLSGGKLR